MAKPTKETKRYSAAERKAYYMGIGAALGVQRKIGSTIKNLSKEEKKSFGNGFDETLLKKPRGYFNNNQKGR